MKVIFLTALLLFINHNLLADKIYIKNSTGYNTAYTHLIDAIISNGHSVTLDNTGSVDLPLNFTSFCNDTVNGFDWLCFFGNANFSTLQVQISDYIASGGKVFYQYEVGCCTNSTLSVSNIISYLTGLNIQPNTNSYIALSNNTSLAGWEATSIGCCVDFYGNAYKGLDGIPALNQLEATSNLNNSTPPISNSSNFGFYFTTTDFTNNINKGAFVGIGDINIWFDGREPNTRWYKQSCKYECCEIFFP
jgi:hypothetical protein